MSRETLIHAAELLEREALTIAMRYPVVFEIPEPVRGARDEMLQTARALRDMAEKEGV